MPTSTHSTEPQSNPEYFRVNIYQGIHKGIRAFMCDTLAKVAALDLDDADEVASVLSQVKELAAFCTDHLNHEDRFVHAAMEARQPGSAAETAGDHVQHLKAVSEIYRLANALEHGLGHAQSVAWVKLQQHLETFVAEGFEHMHFEETYNNDVLWANYSDEEIVGIEHAIVASLSPQDFARCMRWVLTGVSPRERADMLKGIRESAPLPVFENVLEIARVNLTKRDWAKLEFALDLDARRAA